MPTPHVPEGHATINPVILTHDADGLIDFLTTLFDAVPRPEARTMDADGLLIHAEIVIGDTTLIVGERKPDWPFTPSLLQVYVDDLDATLNRARELGGSIVTEPTDMYGTMFSRVLDPWHNLWWIWKDNSEQDWAEADAGEEAADEEAWSMDSAELTYIHDSLLTAMRELSDPRPPS